MANKPSENHLCAWELMLEAYANTHVRLHLWRSFCSTFDVAFDFGWSILAKFPNYNSLVTDHRFFTWFYQSVLLYVITFYDLQRFRHPKINKVSVRHWVERIRPKSVPFLHCKIGHIDMRLMVSREVTRGHLRSLRPFYMFKRSSVINKISSKPETQPCPYQIFFLRSNAAKKTAKLC